MKTNLITAVVAILALALWFPACGSKQEKDREKTVERKADNMDAGSNQFLRQVKVMPK